MVLSDPAKGGLENGIWIDQYDYLNKNKKKHYEKYESAIFPCSVS